jgi:hypothetical protein
LTTKISRVKDKEAGAQLLWLHAQAISQLVYAGYTPQSVIDAVTQGKLSLLKVKQEKNGH